MIDFIITWVDGDDLNWQKDKDKYSHQGEPLDGHSPSRFRDLGTLKYVLRGIDEFAPWVNKVHLVTEGHLPLWINNAHPKLCVHKHSDIFLKKQHLPTFNSSAIEINFLGIPNLANQFVIFNDDMLLLKPVQKTDFFISGKPRDFLIQNPIKIFLQQLLFPSNTFVKHVLNDVSIINKEFNQTKNTYQNFNKYFNIEYGLMGNILNLFATLFGKYYFFEHYHHPQPHLKSTWNLVHKKYSQIMSETSSSKFRHNGNINQYLFRYWNLASGNFAPRLKNNFVTVNIRSVADVSKFIAAVSEKTFVCVNDTPDLTNLDFLKSKELILEKLENILSEKTKFEL